MVSVDVKHRVYIFTYCEFAASVAAMVATPSSEVKKGRCPKFISCHPAAQSRAVGAHALDTNSRSGRREGFTLTAGEGAQDGNT